MINLPNFTYAEAVNNMAAFPIYLNEYVKLKPHIRPLLDINDYEYLLDGFRTERRVMIEAMTGPNDGLPLSLADMLAQAMDYSALFAMIYVDFIGYVYTNFETYGADNSVMNFIRSFANSQFIAIDDDADVINCLAYGKYIVYEMTNKVEGATDDESVYKILRFPVVGKLENDPIVKGINTTLVDEKAWVILKHELGIMAEKSKTISDPIELATPVLDMDFIRYCYEDFTEGGVPEEPETEYKSWSPPIDVNKGLSNLKTK